MEGERPGRIGRCESRGGQRSVLVVDLKGLYGRAVHCDEKSARRATATAINPPVEGRFGKAFNWPVSTFTANPKRPIVPLLPPYRNFCEGVSASESGLDPAT